MADQKLAKHINLRRMRLGEECSESLLNHKTDLSGSIKFSAKPQLFFQAKLVDVGEFSKDIDSIPCCRLKPELCDRFSRLLIESHPRTLDDLNSEALIFHDRLRLKTSLRRNESKPMPRR